MKAKVLIVVPPLVDRDDSKTQMVDRPDFEAYRLVSPVEPTQVAAQVIKAGFETQLFDLGVYRNGGLNELQAKAREFQPDYVCVTQSILTFATAQDNDGAKIFTAVQAAAPKALRILSGGHATNYPGKSVGESNCDYSLKGETDITLPTLLKKLSEKAPADDIQQIPGVSFRMADQTVASNPTHPTVDVTQLELPAYHLLKPSDLEKYYEFPEYAKIRFPEKSLKYRDIMTSRGCILRCSFCSVAPLRGEKQAYRRKSVEQVANEIEQALSQGVEEIHFFDDLFVREEAQILSFCNELKRRNLKFPWFVAQGQPMWPLTLEALTAMKETGLYRVICPLESGNNRVLKKVVGKPTTVEGNHQILQWLKQLDLEIVGMFVVGMPGETALEVLDTVKFAESHPEIDYSVFSIATPMVGTKLMKQVVQEGNLKDQDVINKVIKRTVALHHHNEISQVSLGVIRAFEWDRINFHSEERRRKYCKMVGISMDQLDVVRKYSLETFRFFFPDYDGPTSYEELVRSSLMKDSLQIAPRIS